MPLKIDDKELFAIDSHTHMGRRNTPLGHGIASFLGEDLVRDMDELGLDKAVAFPLGARTRITPSPTRRSPARLPSFRKESSASADQS